MPPFGLYYYTYIYNILIGSHRFLMSMVDINYMIMMIMHQTRRMGGDGAGEGRWRGAKIGSFRFPKGQALLFKAIAGTTPLATRKVQTRSKQHGFPHQQVQASRALRFGQFPRVSALQVDSGCCNPATAAPKRHRTAAKRPSVKAAETAFGCQKQLRRSMGV